MIEIIRYESASKNKTIGYVDIKLTTRAATMIIRKIQHVQSGDRKWFSLPCLAREAEGAMEYPRYWQFCNEDYNKHLLNLLPKLVDEYLAKQSAPTYEMPTCGLDDDGLPF